MENNNKEQIVAALVATGLTATEAEAKYTSMFKSGNNSTQLPLPLIKINNVAGIADIGQLCIGGQKDDDGDVTGYDEILNFADIDFMLVSSKAMYNNFDQDTRQTTVKTKLMPVFTSKAKFIDELSGKTIKTLTDEGVEPKYQVLAVVGIRPKGTQEAFRFFNIYLKGASLYGVNQLLDGGRDASAYQVANIVVKIGKKGAVKYTEIDLTKSTATPLATDDVMRELGALLEVTDTFDKYVDAYNDEQSARSDVPSEDTLPE